MVGNVPHARCDLPLLFSHNPNVDLVVRLTKVMRYPQLLLAGPHRKCFTRLQTIWIPFATTKRTKLIHVGMVQTSGLREAMGGRRWVALGSTREEEGSGDGDRRG